MSKWAITDASVMITTILASSEGWSWKGPSWNQAWLPLRSLPSPDTTMSRLRSDDAVEDRGQLAVAPVVDEGDAEHDRGADADEQHLLEEEAGVEVGRVAAAGGAEDHQAAERARPRRCTRRARGRCGATAAAGLRDMRPRAPGATWLRDENVVAVAISRARPR